MDNMEQKITKITIERANGETEVIKNIDCALIGIHTKDDDGRAIIQCFTTCKYDTISGVANSLLATLDSLDLGDNEPLIGRFLRERLIDSLMEDMDKEDDE